MSNNNSNNQSGVSAAFLLFLLFLGLKLGHVINWSWWLVCLPLYGGLLLVLAIAAITGFGASVGFGIAWLLNTRKRRSHRKAVEARRAEIAARRANYYSQR